MKHSAQTLLLTLLIALVSLPAFAYDAILNGIAYNILSEEDKTCEVAKANSSIVKGDVNLPASVTINGNDYSVTSIEESTFSNCSGLTSITIPDGVTSIGNQAFSDCSGLTSVTIPSSVTSIGIRAFYNCSGLTCITIPGSVTSIGEDAFYRCYKLSEVHINDLAAWCKNAGEWYYSNPLSQAHNLYLNDVLVTDLVIPDGVTSIGYCAFDNCSGLTSVTIPGSVTSIGRETFSNCSGLTSVTIPEGVTSIGEKAFSNCSGLTSVTIPNSVTSIGSYAFANCSGLTSVTIPNSVTSIENGAFESCSGLTSVTIPGSVKSIRGYTFSNCSGLTSVTIPGSVKSIGGGAFAHSGLTSVTIPNSVTVMSDWPDNGIFEDCEWLDNVTISNSIKFIPNKCFVGCSGLTKIIIPSSVTEIGHGAFAGCTSLRSVTIPDSVKEIDYNAFNGCSGLRTIYVYNPEPPAFLQEKRQNWAFADVNKEQCILYVPEGSLSKYKSAAYWNSFANIKEMDPNMPNPYKVKCDAPKVSYANKKLHFESDTEGAKFSYTISCSDVKTDTCDADASLDAAYKIKVYAYKDGMNRSDEVTAMLYWIDGKIEESETGVVSLNAKSRSILVQSNGGELIVSGLSDGEQVTIYDTDGSQLGSAVSNGGEATFSVDKVKGIVIVKVGKDALKVKL